MKMGLLTYTNQQMPGAQTRAGIMGYPSSARSQAQNGLRPTALPGSYSGYSSLPGAQTQMGMMGYPSSTRSPAQSGLQPTALPGGYGGYSSIPGAQSQSGMMGYPSYARSASQNGLQPTMLPGGYSGIPGGQFPNYNNQFVNYGNSSQPVAQYYRSMAAQPGYAGAGSMIQNLMSRGINPYAALGSFNNMMY